MISLAAVKAWPWKLIAQAAAVALLAWLVYLTVSRAWVALPETRQALKDVQAALKAEVECLEKSACAERQAKFEAEMAQKSAEAVADYEKELAELRNRPLLRRVIRVCPDSGDVQNAGTPGRTDAGASAEGLVQRSDEFDTRPLRDLAARADELSAQCRALIRWNDALAK